MAVILHWTGVFSYLMWQNLLHLFTVENEFRGALDSAEKVQELKNAGKINLITPAEVIGLKGDGHRSHYSR